MPKEFYTERDIEDLVRRGVMSLEVHENVVLTELAFERANRLGMKLVQSRAENPPSAPVRPYLSQPVPAQPTRMSQPAPMPSNPAQSAARQAPTAPSEARPEDLQQRIKSAVLARMGSQVDSNLLDVIIQRVLTSTGLK